MPRTVPGDWYPGVIPDNVIVEDGAWIDTSQCFELFRSEVPQAVRLGRGAAVYAPAMFDLGPRARVVVGEYAMLNGPRIICDALIEIGPWCLISWNVVIMDTRRVPMCIDRRREVLRGLAALPPEKRRPDADPSPRPVRIGANVWLGFDAVVLPGITIGEGSVVGARSVVMDDVPPYTLVAGNPARFIRKL